MKNQKGITLIALIITIIVILILVAVTIRTTINSGLFGHAKDAAESWDEAQRRELNIGDNINEVMDQWANGNVTIFDNDRRYDKITTDDGVWEIYKDIDTKTTKVNVYVTSKYYYPSFEQYVLEQYYLQGCLYVYGTPVYSFSDITDWYARFMEQMLGEETGLIKRNEYVKKREETMKIGITFEDILETADIKPHELYKELGKYVIENANTVSVKGWQDYYTQIGDMTIEGTDIPIVAPDFTNVSSDYRFSMPELAYEKLRKEYERLYGEKAKMTIGETEKNKEYEIQLPDGKIERVKGEDLCNAKFRYITTKNGDLQIKISDGATEKTIDYEGVNNIGECIYTDDEYVYTYNCLPEMNYATLFSDINENMQFRFDLGRMERNRTSRIRI